MPRKFSYFAYVATWSRHRVLFQKMPVIFDPLQCEIRRLKNWECRDEVQDANRPCLSLFT